MEMIAQFLDSREVILIIRNTRIRLPYTRSEHVRGCFIFSSMNSLGIYEFPTAGASYRSYHPKWRATLVFNDHWDVSLFLKLLDVQAHTALGAFEFSLLLLQRGSFLGRSTI
ncbi:hypothetical protein AUI06_03720 [archaeon 13_2_20CM_2_52_21]|nr:MAG: hypothetical protein AUI06_03720 [archaeon 13_2_20CM_2_52_21]